MKVKEKAVVRKEKKGTEENEKERKKCKENDKNIMMR